MPPMIIPHIPTAPNMGVDANPFTAGWLPTTQTPGATPGQAITSTPPIITSWLTIKPWYKTWWGIALIAGAGFLGYRYLKKRK